MMSKSLIEIFEELPDPRSGNAIRHKLIDVITIGIMSILSGHDEYTEMELFAQMKESWLRGFLELPGGIPSHDTFGDIFSAINPMAFRKCFMQWVQAVRENISGEIISIDGKNIRGSRDNANGKRATHIVSAWAQNNQIVLGQLATEEKSNETTAIPELLKLLEIKGCIVTIDAAGCQKKIAKQIVYAGADYVLALKGNQENLHEDVKLYFENEDIAHKTTTHDKGHGRVETREYRLETGIDWLPQKSDWMSLNAIGMVKSRVLERDVVREETRYFITSLTDVKSFAKAVRAHWGIENSLHWSLDVTFGEDSCRARAGAAAENLNILRHLAIGLLKNETSINASLNLKRKRCALSNDYLLKVLDFS